MTITITDPILLDQLARASGVVELNDPTGRVLARFTVEPFGKPPPGYKLPITDEELERRRQEKTGRSLDEILRDLKRQHGEG